MAPQQQLINRLSTFSISIPLLILFISTVFLLFFSSNDDVAAIWPQCSPTTPTGFLSHVSRIPLIGQPLCFLISFFEYAMASSRGFAVMSVVLSFVGALLTVSTIESARIYNSPNFLIRNPTLPWLFFNLAGGAVAWQIIIVPAFISRSRRAHHIQSSASPRFLSEGNPSSTGQSASSPEVIDARDPNRGSEKHHLRSSAEIYAIPLSIIIGYVVPCTVMLFATSPTSVAIWLFFPLWVSLARQAIRYILILLPIFPQFTNDESDTHHIESFNFSLTVVYAVPVLLSILSQVIIFNNLLDADDGSPVTRAALGFIEIDFSAIALTVFYLLLLEAGWKIFGIALVCCVISGPGTGLVVGWIMREKMKEVDTTNSRD